jgi:oligopeptide transport system permease protein
MLFLLLSSVFFLIRLIPGGPFESDRILAPEIQAQLESVFGLNDPLPLQYLNWLSSLARGELGVSFQQPDFTVRELIQSALPISFGLGLMALLVAILLAVPIGVLSAYALENQRYLFLNQVIRILVLCAASLPGFLLAYGLVWVFSIQLGWLPPGLWAELLDRPSYWVLPTLTLALRPLALISRQIRGSTLESLRQDYIRTARAKGLSQMQVLLRHALRNAWVPIIGLLPPIAAQLLTGSFLVESIFQIPGLGRSFVNAVLNRDYFMVLGSTLVFGLVLILANLFSEALLLWADPRARRRESL